MNRASYDLVKTGLEYQPRLLRARFVVGAFHTPRQLEVEAFKAMERFVEDMGKQGWTYRGGLKVVRGPMAATIMPTSIPKAPPRIKRRLGPSDTTPLKYADNTRVLPKVNATDVWEYEIAGLFSRPLLPMEVDSADLANIVKQARRRRGALTPTG